MKKRKRCRKEANNLDKELINTISQLIKDELKPINQKLNTIDDKVAVTDSKIVSMNSNIKNMDSNINSIESQQKENTQILKALEHASQVHKAELDNLNIQVAKLSGNEEKIKKLERNLNNHEHDIVIKTGKIKIS
jgi:chromosome segregation ATPase